MKLSRLIGLWLAGLSIIFNIGAWWAIWDLVNTIIYHFMSRGAEFPGDVGFPLPYYMKWIIEAIPLSQWSYVFDVCSFVSVLVSFFCVSAGVFLIIRR